MPRVHAHGVLDHLLVHPGGHRHEEDHEQHRKDRGRDRQRRAAGVPPDVAPGQPQLEGHELPLLQVTRREDPVVEGGIEVDLLQLEPGLVPLFLQQFILIFFCHR